MKEYHNHTFKKGEFITPLNSIENLCLTNWHKDIAPEFLWIGLIIKRFGRINGINKCINISNFIKDNLLSLHDLRFTSILALKTKESSMLYNYLISIIEKETLDCLCAMISIFDNHEFNLYFNCFFEYDERIRNIETTLKEMYDFQSQLATDINFINVYFYCISGKLSISNAILLECLQNYNACDVSDERMKMYRPMIRSTAQCLNMELTDNDFTNKFWEEFSQMKECTGLFKKNELRELDDDFYINFRNILIYYNHLLMEICPLDNKALVLFGILNYSFRLVTELRNQKAFNSIIARTICRIVLENYIISCYLIKEEKNHIDIWNEYQSYGCGKLKLVLERHKDLNDAFGHLDYDYLKLLMSDGYNEDFINMDTRYFDKNNLNHKFKETNNDVLYNMYDYDSLYEHGIWPILRESVLIKCKEPSHDYHWILDVDGKQQLKSVSEDIELIIRKHISLLNEQYNIPEELVK